MAERAQPHQAPDESSALAALVAECIDRMEDEGPAILDVLCREHPDHATLLRQRIQRLERMGLVGAPPAEPELPERLGGFRILSLLGRGGMGVVYLAEQESLGRRVALKLVRPEHSLFPGARERFRREIAAVARLQHEGIVPVYAAGEAAGVPFFAMEHVRGAGLDEVLDVLAGTPPARLTGSDLRRAIEQVLAGRPPDPAPRRGGSSAGGSALRLFEGTWPQACLRVGSQVALALQHAHESGVLHRDVKPSNVMVTPEGRVLLLDFGLAATEGNTRLTSTGSQIGSLAWMSPEQVRGGRALDAGTDVYSLGATLYELLTLRSPFVGADLEETRQRVLEGRCAALRDLNYAVSRDAETVCQKAMELERERRYADAAALADDLRDALELRPVSARRPGPWHKARRWAQRHPGATVAAGLAALLLVGGPVGYGVVQGRAAEKEQRLNEDLARALADEQLQRARAERSFDKSLAAVDELLATVGADDLRDLPQFEPVRSRLLERALDFYRGLEADATDAGAVREEQARTRRSIADLLKELGRGDEARAGYEESIAEARELLALEPGSADVRHALASTLSELAGLDYVETRHAEAETRWQEARSLLEGLAGEPEPNPVHVHDLAVVLQSLGMIAHARGDLEAALEHYRRGAEIADGQPDDTGLVAAAAGCLARAATTSADLGRAHEAADLFRQAWARYQALLRLEPGSRSLRNSAVEVSSNYGLLLLTGDDRELAELVLRQGFDLALGLTRDFPADPEYRKRCAVIGLNVVAELMNQERAEEAEPIARESCAQLEKLVAEMPERIENTYYLGAARAALAAIHLEQQELDEAREQARLAVALNRQALGRLHGNPAVLAQLASALAMEADVRQASGEVGAALDELDEARALGVLRPDAVYQIAETAARCTAAAGTDEALRRRAEDLALDALSDAIANGFSDFARVRTLEAFALLRARPEFDELVPPPLE